MVASQVSMEVRYQLAGPYAVQGGGTYDPGVDQGVERAPDGWPLIPASSWRGRVRAHLESLLRGLGVPVCTPPNPARTCPHDGPVLARLHPHGRRFCPVCELFGSPWRPSRIVFTDLTHPQRGGQPEPIAARVNVAINRFLGAVEEQRLVAYEAAGYGADEASRVLAGRVSGCLEPSQAGLLLVALRLPTHLGGKKARGLGLIQQMRLQVTIQPAPAGPEEPVEASTIEAWIEQALEEVKPLAASAAL